MREAERFLLSVPQEAPQRHLDIQNRTQYFAMEEARHYSLPPLDALLDADGKIIGDPQVLLQFSIVGFGKCGTTTLMEWLASHPELQSLRNEMYSLAANQPSELIRRLHKKLSDPNLQRGYKCPTAISHRLALDYYRTLWPKTKLFVGVSSMVDVIG